MSVSGTFSLCGGGTHSDGATIGSTASPMLKSFFTKNSPQAATVGFGRDPADVIQSPRQKVAPVTPEPFAQVQVAAGRTAFVPIV